MGTKVKAKGFATRDELIDAGVPGGYCVREADDRGRVFFWYCCPCGCGAVYVLDAGRGFKPAQGPSWELTQEGDNVTLYPSLNLVGHWHGWLTDGVWSKFGNA